MKKGNKRGTSEGRKTVSDPEEKMNASMAHKGKKSMGSGKKSKSGRSC